MVEDEVKIGTYRHYKGGEYRVLGCACNTETGEELIVYQGLGKGGELWVRPKDMFLEFVNVNGKKIPRFKYIS